MRGKAAYKADLNIAEQNHYTMYKLPCHYKVGFVLWLSEISEWAEKICPICIKRILSSMLLRWGITSGIGMYCLQK